MIGEPSLVESVVAGVENDGSVMSVNTTLDIEAQLGVESNVSSGFVEPLDLLSNLCFEWSDDNHGLGLQGFTLLSRKGVSLLDERSD